MDARTWWGLQDIAPRKAAMLLCRLNPSKRKRKDPERIFVDGDESSPKRYRLLLLTFKDVAKAAPQARTLSQWLGIARDKKLQYHPWIDEYERGINLEALAKTPATHKAPEKGEPPSAVEQSAPAALAEVQTQLINEIRKAADIEKEPKDTQPETSASEQAANNRKNYDLTGKRGCGRLILENWDDIEKLHGTNVDGRKVLNLLKRRVDASELPKLKAIQNRLSLLRNEKLIP